MTAPVSPSTGRCWVLGDDINTDYLAPGKYMKFGIDVIARHCLQDVVPRFAQEVRPGDILIAGSNFGAGSSREQAAEVLLHIGVRCVIARSFAGLFYRNAFNLGLPLLIGDAAGTGLQTGTKACVDLIQAQLCSANGARTLQCEPIPPHLRALIEDGGLVLHLEKRLARERSKLSVPPP